MKNLSVTAEGLFDLMKYRVIWVVLNGVFDLSVWSVIDVCGSIVSREAGEDDGTERSELERYHLKST